MCCGKRESTVQTAGATVRQPNHGLEPVPFVKTHARPRGIGAAEHQVVGQRAGARRDALAARAPTQRHRLPK